MRYLFYLLPAIFFLVNILPARAAVTSSVNTTVQVGFCGYPHILEIGEDCDGDKLGGKTCISLGYSDGSLSCDYSCSLDISSCTVPSIDPGNVDPDEVRSLQAAGYLVIPPSASVVSTPSLTATESVTINIPEEGGNNSSIYIPEDVVITRNDGGNFDPTDLSASSIPEDSLSGFSSNVSVGGSLQWGLPDVSLDFSIPVTISIYVGTALNGRQLDVYRSVNTNSGWTNEGIVSPKSCIVSGGLCVFQTTKASYFAATGIKSSSSGSTTDTTLTASATTTESSAVPSASASASTAPSVFTIPDVLKFYTDYLDAGGRIKKSDLFAAIGTWVNNWKATTLFPEGGENAEAVKNKCDIDGNSECNLIDLSVLLFYVEK